MTTSGDLRDANQHLLLAGLDAQEEAAGAHRDLDRLNAILENLSEAVTIVDGTGNVVLMNHASRDLCGLSEGQAWSPHSESQLDRRRPDGRLLPPEEWPITRLRRGEEFHDLELRVASRHGTQALLSADGSLLRDPRGRVTMGILVQRDITDQRELERRRETFLVAAAHDLKTPLTSVKGFTQLLLRRLNRDDAFDIATTRQNLEQIDTTVDRMVSQIDELLKRHQDEPRPVSHESMDLCDLTALVTRVVAEHRAWRELPRISLQNEEGTIVGAWDRGELERVLSNLLSNAVKYSAEGSPIEVTLTQTTRADGVDAVLEVRDRGMGIPPSDLPHIFESRFRAGNVTEIAGSGIGLSGVRQIVESYGGSVSAEPHPQGGTRFTVLLPM